LRGFLGLFLLDSFVDLFAMHRDFSGCVDAETDLIALHAKHRHGDIVSGLDLERRSQRTVGSLEFDFADVWWAIPPALDGASLVRVQPVPRLCDVQEHWSEVGPALLALLES
jgi:hypothetical protein